MAEVLKIAFSSGLVTTIVPKPWGPWREYVMGRVPLVLWQSNWNGFPNSIVPPTTLSKGAETGTGNKNKVKYKYLKKADSRKMEILPI